jgi:hypothetical protein
MSHRKPFPTKFPTLSLIFLASLTVHCGQKSVSPKEPGTKQPPTQQPINAEQTPPTGSNNPVPPAGGPQIPEAHLTNLGDIVAAIGARQYHESGMTGARVKVAILDNGFTGVEQEIGKTLPPDTKIVQGVRNPPQDTLHGTRLAQIVYSVATGKSTYDAKLPGPQLYLINSNGFSNFNAAVDTAIAEGVQIILYSQVWEYGGNGDGSGFINQVVNRAIDKGIVWVNAAGNYGLTNFSTYVRTDIDGRQIILPHMRRFLRFVVPQQLTPVKFVISWNDFSDSMNYRTAIDLDMQIYNGRGVEIAKTELIQDGKEHFDDPLYTDHAREILRADLEPGIYYIAVTTKNATLSPNLKLRITADGYGVRFIDQSRNDSVLVPADNPRVLTVGAYDAAFSSEKQWLHGSVGKPDLWTVSRSVFSDGMDVRGTSTAAAIVAGALTLYSSAGNALTPASVRMAVQSAVLTRTANHGDLDAACRSYQEFSMDCPGTYPQAPLILRLPGELNARDPRYFTENAGPARR